MSTKLSLKMLMRTPLKSAIAFLLIAALTFGMHAKVNEYVVSSQEMTRLQEHYQIVGTVETSSVPKRSPGDPDALFPEAYEKTKQFAYVKGWPAELQEAYYEETIRSYGAIPASVMDAIAKLPHVASTTTRYMGAGVIDAYYRIDGNAYYYDYTARMIAEGIVEKIDILARRAAIVDYSISLSSPSLLAGNPKWLAGKDTVRIRVPTLVGNPIGISTFFSTSTERYAAIVSPYLTSDDLSGIEPGDSVIFVGRVGFVQGEPHIIFIGDRFTDYWCKELTVLTDVPGEYLEEEDNAALLLAIEITNADLHTFDMVYTDEMAHIPSFTNRQMTISAGRALTAEDLGTVNCVISARFLRENGLSIGDPLTVKLGDRLFEQNAALGAVAAIPERYAEPVETVTLTIVGTHVNLESQKKQAESVHHNYSENAIFVPLTLLPSSANMMSHQIKPGEFTFVLDHPNNLEAFIEKTKDFMAENNLTLLLGNNAQVWRELKSSYNSAATVNLLTIALFSASGLIASIFVVYLFIVRRSREYAVMRALGMPGKAAGRVLFVPLMTLSLAAITIGSAASWVYGRFQNSRVSPIEAVACIVVSSAFLVVPALLSLRKLRRTQPLMLLQRNTKRKDKVQGEPTVLHMPTMVLVDKPDATIPSNKSGGSFSTTRHVLRYILRHSRRAIGQTLLSTLAAAFLFGAVGQTLVMQTSYDELFHSIRITGYFAGNVPIDQALQLAAKPYIAESYLAGKLSVWLGTSATTMIVSTDSARYTEDAEIVYMDGYDSASFADDTFVCIANDTMMETFRLSLGDQVRFVTAFDFYELFHRYMQGGLAGQESYTTIHAHVEMLRKEGRDAQADEIDAALAAFHAALKNAGQLFTIVGKTAYQGVSAQPTDIALAPAGEWLSTFSGSNTLLEEASFTLADNTLAERFRSDGNRYAKQGELYSPFLQFVLDTSALENITRAKALLTTLFPIILAVAVAIDALIAVLVILPLTKDAARMRALGAPSSHVCASLALEQILLCGIGLALAMMGLVLYNGAILKSTFPTLLYCGALFFATVVTASVLSSFVISKRKPLATLHVKE